MGRIILLAFCCTSCGVFTILDGVQTDRATEATSCLDVLVSYDPTPVYLIDSSMGAETCLVPTPAGIGLQAGDYVLITRTSGAALKDYCDKDSGICAPDPLFVCPGIGAVGLDAFSSMLLIYDGTYWLCASVT
jgi:hypothetical protein